MHFISNTSTEASLFLEQASLFNGKIRKKFESPLSWHNVFHREVVCQVPELLFTPLFSKDMGAPNASIRILIGMMAIKEGFGLSDSQLFESCHFNLLYKKALGLLNIDDAIPAESTYYLFRQRIVVYADQSGKNLLEDCFAKITKLQAIEYNVSGRRIRMDSKLMSSNISWLSRYELIHETLQMFLKKYVCPNAMSESEKEKLAEVLKFEGNKIVYNHTSEEVKTRLEDIGVIISKLIESYQGAKGKEIDNLRRVFMEQYQIEEDTKIVLPRDKKEIKASSLQSPHDPDADFRDKDGQVVKGFSINITESCDKGNDLNLISDVTVEKATTSDNSFFEGAIDRSSGVFGENPEIAHADGAYNSPSNQKYCKENKIKLHLHAIQGRRGRYAYQFNESGELIVTDTETGNQQQATAIISRKGEQKWRFTTWNGKSRYVKQAEIETYNLRVNIENTPKEELQHRNNVEATVFQLGYHYPDAQTRYRGHIKHQMWANMRCLWVNCVRITNYKVKQAA